MGFEKGAKSSDDPAGRFAPAAKSSDDPAGRFAPAAKSSDDPAGRFAPAVIFPYLFLGDIYSLVISPPG